MAYDQNLADAEREITLLCAERDRYREALEVVAGRDWTEPPNSSGGLARAALSQDGEAA